MRTSVSSGLLVAQEELELFFAAAPGMWGLRGAPFDGGGTTVWDPPRAAREHWRMVRGAWETSHAHLRAITASCKELRERHYGAWSVAAWVLSPRRWPDMLAAEMSRGVRGGNLTGLLLTSETLGKAYARHCLGECPEWEVDAPPAELLSFASDRASASNVDTLSKRRFFEPLRNEGEARFSGALAVYDRIRLARALEASKSKAREMRRAFG